MRKILLSLVTGWFALGLQSVFGQAGETILLIPQGSVWRYYDQGVNLGTVWRQSVYAPETSWLSGPAQLGFGDGDEATVVNGGPSSSRYITTYFRRSFVLDDTGAITNLMVWLLRDDGAVVFLNGAEVFRSNMPLPPAVITYSTLASSSVPAADETVNFYPQSVDPALLVAGTNVVAVEIHQQSSTSSDISFDLRLEAIRVPSVGPPVIAGQPQNRAVVAGSNTTLHVSAGGAAPLRYQWSFNGANVAGATNSTLAINAVSLKDAGLYRVLVTNSLGSALSSNATLTVLDFDSGIREDVEPDIHLFFWSQFSGMVLGTNYGGSVSGSNSMWFGGDGDRFAVTRGFDTSAGAAVAFYLRMADNSRSFWELPDLPGEGVVFEYSTNGGVSWMTNAIYDSVVVSNWTYQYFELPASAQSPQTMFRWRQLSNSGNCCDNWALDDMAIALPPSGPRIFGQPANQVAGLGYGATFSVGASGIHPLFYQWKFGGVDIPDATNATLVLTNLTLDQNGLYSVFISNALGTTLSSDATLTVETLGEDFRIATLSTNGAFVKEHYDLTGGERGGFAVCGDHLLYSGEFGIEGFDLENLALDTTLASFTGLLASDLQTGVSYGLGNVTNLVTSIQRNDSVNYLVEMNPATGRPTGRKLPLTRAIPITYSYGNFGIFSGYGRVVVYNGSHAYNISTRSGLVTDLGAMTFPSRRYSYGLGAFWGVAEYFSNAVSVVYLRDSFTSLTITRTRIPDGVSTNLLSGNIGSMSHLSVSPRLNRWYFHSEGSPIFTNNGIDLLGYADASFVYAPSVSAAMIAGQPLDQMGAFGGEATFRVGIGGSFPVDYQWQFNGADIPDATNASITVGPVSPEVAGAYSVRVSNAAGTAQSSNAVLTVLTLPPDKFQVTKLSTNNSYVVEHESVTGDNRGALAVSSNKVFYSGDSSTARFNIGDLSQGTALGRIFDALVSDLQTERVYSLANGANALVSTTLTNIITHLLEHDPDTGLLTGNRLALSTPIPLPANYGNIGLFSGYGRIVIHDGSNVFHVAMPSGQVSYAGALPPLTHNNTESWAYWGVAEFFNSALHLVYVRNPYTIARTRVIDGFTTTLGRFDYLANMAALTVSPHIGRWYFHFYYSSQFGAGNELLGFADATFRYSAPALSPRVLIQPFTQTAAEGSTIQLKVSGAGTAPLEYQWRFNGSDIVDATNATLLLSNISLLNIGSYSVVVSNEFGTTISSNAALSVVALPGENFRIASLSPSNSYAIEHRDLTSYDRGGLALSGSRVFYNGTLATAGYDLDDLSSGAVSPNRGEAFASDLRTEILYSLATGASPLPYGGGVVNSLIQLDSYTGDATTNIIPLSATIDLTGVGGNIGIFSGYGRIVVHNGVRAYDIMLPSGQVTELGVMSIPGHIRSSGWAYWGTAEYYQGLIYLALVQNSSTIVRVRVPDGAVTTIQSFSYLGNMNCISVAPYRKRWYFHHEYSSQFSSSFTETVGFADATFDFNDPALAPEIAMQPADRVAIASRPFSLSVAASGGHPFGYQWQWNESDVMGATKATLVFPEMSAALAGNYRVIVNNQFGAITSRTAVVTVRDLFSVSQNFAIASLTTNNSRIVDHNSITGDDRGGIALSGSELFYSGDTSTARFLASDLSGGAALGVLYDALVSNLRNETVYTFASSTNVLNSNGGVATRLIQLDGASGALTTTVIPLSSPIVLSNYYYGTIAFFSGYDRIAIYNGQRLYSIELSDGTVLDHGAMSSPNHTYCENWAYWGVAEQIDHAIWIAYVQNSRTIVRTRVPDGFTTNIATFSNLGDMCSFTVSPTRNRWYFHFEDSSQFGGNLESVGYATAAFDAPPSISGLYSRTILEDSMLGPIPFRISDASGQSNSVSIAAISSNTNLVASSNIVITDAGTNWLLSAAPFANSNGVTTISVLAQVGTHTPIVHSFTLTVVAVNDPPSFTMPASHTILEDAGSQYISDWITNMSVGPANENSGNYQTLIVTVTNDNPSLFASQPMIYAYYYSRSQLYYSPAPNAFGTATVSVIVRDSGGTVNGGHDTTVQNFTINILPVNDRPSFTAGPNVTVREDAGPQFIPTWATNISAGPNETNQTVAFSVSVVAIRLPVLITPRLMTVSQDSARPGQGGDASILFASPPMIDALGNLSFTPATNAVGFANLKVTLQDDGGTNDFGIDTSFSAYFTITISPVNDPPTAIKAPDPVVLEDSNSQTFSNQQPMYAPGFGIPGISGSQVFSNWLTSITAGPADEHQLLTIAISIDNTNLFRVQPQLVSTLRFFPGTGSDRNLVFTPATNAFGVATGTILLQDDGGTADGGVDTTMIPFTITILPVNDAPSFTAGADLTVAADAGLQAFANWATNISAGPPNESNQKLSFMVTNGNRALFSTQPAISASGTLSFAPARNGNGSADVSVTLHDDGGTTNGGIDVSATAVFRITVTPVENAPFANSQAITLNEDTPTAITLDAGDIDGDTISYVIGLPSHGVLSGTAPNLLYSPAANYFGSDSFTFKVNDGKLSSALATVSLTILPVNDAPTAIARAFGRTILGTNETNSVFLAPDNLQAWVVFDGSRTTDIESNAFQCFWYEQGQSNAFAVGLRVTNLVELGSYTVVLYAWDGAAGGSDIINLHVITPAEAVAKVMISVDEAAIDRATKQSLIASLKTAAASFAKGNLRPAINELLAFDNKLKAQLAAEPALAEQLNNQVQEIVDALSDYAATGRTK